MPEPGTPDPNAIAAGEAPAPSGHGLSHRAARNTLALIGGRLAGIALTGFSSVLLTRCLGAAGYGQYASIQAYVMLFSWASSFGLEAILPRELARRPQSTRDLLAAASLISAALSALALGVVLIAAGTMGYVGLLLPVVLMAVDLIALTPLRLPGAVYQADLRQWWSVAAGMARQVAWVAILAAAWLAGAGLIAVIAGRLIASLVAIAILLLGLRGRIPPRQDTPAAEPGGLSKELFRASLPIALTALAACVARRVDQVILHRLVDTTFVGRYAAATNLVELFNILPTAVMSSLFPLLVKSHDSSREFNRYVGEAFRYLLVSAFGACVVVSLFGARLMTLLFGASFSGAGPLASVLIWSEVASFVIVVMTNVVLARGLQRFLPIATVVGAVLNLGLNLILIPRSGTIGAAWATVISYGAVALVLSLGPSEARPVVLVAGRIAIAPAALSVASLVIATHLSTSPVARLVIGVVVYLAGVLVTRTMRLSDLRTLGALMFARKPRR